MAVFDLKPHVPFEEPQTMGVTAAELAIRYLIVRRFPPSKKLSGTALDQYVKLMQQSYEVMSRINGDLLKFQTGELD